MSLPDLTDLQFAILCILGRNELSGQELREELTKHNSMGLAAFYRVMSRLEEAGLVKGRYEQKVIEGHLIKERRYRSTAQGFRQVDAKRLFVSRFPIALGGAANA